MAYENPKDNPVHYPEDRRFRIWMRRPAFLILLALVIVPVAAAWIQFTFFGLPPVPDTIGSIKLDFPLWLRITHFLNIIFILLLMRSGLSILMDHPRLYFNDGSTPGTEWIRFTPLEVPRDRVWTAKEDARYITPWLGLPGYRHTVGMARHWHLSIALLWFANGIFYVSMLFATGEWTRIVPTTWQVIPGAWAMFVHYATLHIPNEFLAAFYNPLQQITYFTIVFICAPLSLLTGLAMSPAITSRFPWYDRIFGGRQSARSIHFLLFVGYIVFIIGHVALVAITGFSGNMNRIVFGVDSWSMQGIIVGTLAMVGVGLILWLVHWLAWRYPRAPQQVVRFIHFNIMERLLFSHLKRIPAGYSKKDISPYFWPNGKVPASEEWKKLAAGKFGGYRLKIYGLVENPVELSLDEIKALGKYDQITMQHCIQGWTGIAHWGGVQLKTLADIVKPEAEAKAVVFRSFGEGLYGGEYYDTQSIQDIMNPQCILAYEMNYKTLGELYGAPLRLRNEKQLGYKMVKWIKSVEFVGDVKDVGKGYGGKNEDDEFFDLLPEI